MLGAVLLGLVGRAWMTRRAVSRLRDFNIRSAIMRLVALETADGFYCKVSGRFELIKSKYNTLLTPCVLLKDLWLSPDFANSMLLLWSRMLLKELIHFLEKNNLNWHITTGRSYCNCIHMFLVKIKCQWNKPPHLYLLEQFKLYSVQTFIQLLT